MTLCAMTRKARWRQKLSMRAGTSGPPFGGAERQRRCDAGLQQDHQQRVRHRGGRRVSLLAQHRRGFALAGGGTRFNVAMAAAATRPVPGRRLSPDTQGAAFIAARWLWLAGRHHQPHRHRRRHRHLRARFNANGFPDGWRRLRVATRRRSHAYAAAVHHYRCRLREQAVSGANTFALAYNGKDVTATRTIVCAAKSRG